MIIPVRCFTCGKVLGNKWEYYQNKVSELEEEYAKKQKKENSNSSDSENYKNLEPIYKKELLDQLGLSKMCCRRHMLSHIDMIDVI
jgi:DNA-directed RNA polymerase subunit N (RpoN/RPB10)